MAVTLDRQVAMISGGLGDIGRAVALELAQRGADVAVGDILEPSSAGSLRERIQRLGRRCRYDRVDVADATAVATWVNEVERDLGLPTLIVPNAAIVQLVRIGELTAQQWRRELAVNLDGAFYLAHEAAKRLLHHGRAGRIVFVGSWAGHAVHMTIPTYCVSKAGLRMLCKCMAAELAPHGILVNEVAPGYVDAGLTGKILDEQPDLREPLRESVPVRRLIEPEEVAAQVAYLCEPGNSHFAGMTLLMDGGLSLLGSGGKR